MNRAPKIVRGPLWLGNGEQGLNAEFDSYSPVAHGKYELRWGTMFSNKDLFIVVGPCDFPTLVVQYCFLESLAWFRTVDVGVNLPYAGVSHPSPNTARVHFLATIGKTMKTVEVTITGIKGLHGEKIEDGFNNASARMELQARHGMILPQTGRMPRELPKFKGYTVDHRLREFRNWVYGEKMETIPFDSPKGRKLLQEMEGLGRAPQTEAICPACAGPGGSMGILGRKEWFRCRNCGMEWSRDVGKRVPQVGTPPSPQYRVFDGKHYRLYDFETSREKAEANAAEWKRKGHRVRIIETRDGFNLYRTEEDVKHRTYPKFKQYYVDVEDKVFVRMDGKEPANVPFISPRGLELLKEIQNDVNEAIKERERGKIRKLPDFSLGDLRRIKTQADRIYR